MEQINLSVQVRESKGSRKVKYLRRAGVIPAVVYGGEDQPANVQISRNEFDRIKRQHGGETVIFKLQVVAGEKKVAEFPAMVKAVAYNPVSDLVDHLDFLRISMDKEITIRVPLILKGEAVGLKKPGATLEQMMRELEILALPKNVPQHIEIDITHLDILHSVHVGDLKLPQGVRTKRDPGAAIAAVVYSTREAEPTAAEGAVAPTLEVIKEKPKDEKAAGAAAPAAGAAAKPAAAKPEAKK